MHVCERESVCGGGRAQKIKLKHTLTCMHLYICVCVCVCVCVHVCSYQRYAVCDAVPVF